MVKNHEVNLQISDPRVGTTYQPVKNHEKLGEGLMILHTSISDL